MSHDKHKTVAASWQNNNVKTRIPSLIFPPIGFAHRGGMAHAHENTLQAFTTAIAMGATGIETDAWITADGEIVLIHDGYVKKKPWLPGWLLGRPIASHNRFQLPSYTPTLTDYYQHCGLSLPLSIDVKDPAAFGGIVAIADKYKALKNLWVCHDNLDLLALWRETAPQVQLVHSVRRNRLQDSHEQHAARLSELGVKAVNLRRGSWSGGLVTLYHRFHVFAFAWDVQQVRHIEALIDSGVDAVYSDHVDRLTKVLERFQQTARPLPNQKTKRTETKKPPLT